MPEWLVIVLAILAGGFLGMWLVGRRLRRVRRLTTKRAPGAIDDGMDDPHL